MKTKGQNRTPAPRLRNGQFLSRECPRCGNGTLQRAADNDWRCDGLLDPDDPDKELIACEYGVYDGVSG